MFTSLFVNCPDDLLLQLGKVIIQTQDWLSHCAYTRAAYMDEVIKVQIRKVLTVSAQGLETILFITLQMDPASIRARVIISQDVSISHMTLAASANITKVSKCDGCGKCEFFMLVLFTKLSFSIATFLVFSEFSDSGMDWF